MNRFLAAMTVAVCVAVPAAAFAQAKPDFSGSWTLDEAKSDPAPMGRAGGGGGRGGRMGGAPATAMTIKQTATDLSIDRTTPMGTQTVAYKLDGSESKNSMGMGTATSKASWKGSQLVIASTQTMEGRGGGQMTMESTETYSRDGDSLTIEVTRNTPMGSQTRKLVYKRN